MNALSDYAYQSDGSGMLILLLILGAIITYLLFSKGFWLDRFMQDRKWEGQDIEPDYNTNQHSKNIDEAISQEKIPYTPSLDIPFDDPEVPNRPSKQTSKKKTKKKRVYKRRKKK